MHAGSIVPPEPAGGSVCAPLGAADASSSSAGR